MKRKINYLYLLFYSLLIIGGALSFLKAERLNEKNVAICLLVLGVISFSLTALNIFKKSYNNSKNIFLISCVAVIIITGLYELLNGKYVSGVLLLAPAVFLIVYSIIEKISKNSK